MSRKTREGAERPARLLSSVTRWFARGHGLAKIVSDLRRMVELVRCSSCGRSSKDEVFMSKSQRKKIPDQRRCADCVSGPPSMSLSCPRSTEVPNGHRRLLDRDELSPGSQLLPQRYKDGMGVKKVMDGEVILKRRLRMFQKSAPMP